MERESAQQRQRPKHILVVQRDPVVSRELCEALRREGYRASAEISVRRTMRATSRSDVDLVLIESVLPDGSGLEACRKLRQTLTVPIVLLGTDPTEFEAIAALQAGADGYVAMPFSLNELLARVAALLRRTSHAAPTTPAAEAVEMGGFRIDRAARRVVVNGTDVRLAQKEFDLLWELTSNPGRVLTRPVIIERVWGQTFAGKLKTVDSHVRWLRDKLESVPELPFRITTVFGVGYRLDPLTRGGRGVSQFGDIASP